MIKVHRIVIGTTVFGLMMIVWAYGRPLPAVTQAGTDSVRAVQLRITFGSGDAANVTEVEGGAIKVENNGQKLTIIPYGRDRGQFELPYFKPFNATGKR